MDVSPDNVSTVVPEDIHLEDGDSLASLIVEDTESTFDFSEKTWMEDLTLVVEGKKLFVNRSMLAVASPVFRKMFESDFKERLQDEIELPGKKYADILEFLRCFYPNVMRRMTDTNIMQVLPLADEYQMKGLKDNCEICLLDIVKEATSTVDLLKYITQAGIYRLGKLKQKCMTSLAEKNLDELEDADKNNNLSLEDSHALLLILSKQQRVALEETRKIIEHLNETNAAAQQRQKYFISGLPKIDVSKFKEFEGAQGADISISIDTEELKKRSYIGWSVDSSMVYCNGLEWRVKIKTSINKHYFLNAELECQSKNITNRCPVTGRFVLINMFSSKENLSKSFDHIYSKNSKLKGIDMILLSDLTNDTNGYLMNDMAQIEVYFLVI